MAGLARGIEVGLNETIEPPLGFDPTLAEGNETVYERWMDLCIADSKCSELYGLSETTNLQQFIHLITLVSPFPGDPLYSENALVYNIYGKTPQAIENQTLVDQMKLRILCSNFVCGVNEKPVVKNGTVKCNPLPGRSPSDRNVEDVIIKLLIAAGSILLLVYVVKTGYTFSKDSWKASIQAFIQTQPPLPKSGNTTTTTMSQGNTTPANMRQGGSNVGTPVARRYTGTSTHYAGSVGTGGGRKRIPTRGAGRGVRNGNVWS
ncbi:MAG: hypothetical protein ACTSUE_26460 [Promethearchaeota archaeon]